LGAKRRFCGDAVLHTGGNLTVCFAGSHREMVEEMPQKKEHFGEKVYMRADEARLQKRGEKHGEGARRPGKRENHRGEGRTAIIALRISETSGTRRITERLPVSCERR